MNVRVNCQIYDNYNQYSQIFENYKKYIRHVNINILITNNKL